MTHLKKDVRKGIHQAAPSDDRGARGAKASGSRKLLGRRSPGDVWIFSKVWSLWKSLWKGKWKKKLAKFVMFCEAI